MKTKAPFRAAGVWRDCGAAGEPVENCYQLHNINVKDLSFFVDFGNHAVSSLGLNLFPTPQPIYMTARDALVLEDTKVVKLVGKIKVSGGSNLTIELQCFDQFVKPIFPTSKTDQARDHTIAPMPGQSTASMSASSSRRNSIVNDLKNRRASVSDALMTKMFKMAGMDHKEIKKGIGLSIIDAQSVKPSRQIHSELPERFCDNQNSQNCQREKMFSVFRFCFGLRFTRQRVCERWKLAAARGLARADEANDQLNDKERHAKVVRFFDRSKLHNYVVLPFNINVQIASVPKAVSAKTPSHLRESREFCCIELIKKLQCLQTVYFSCFGGFENITSP